MRSQYSTVEHKSYNSWQEKYLVQIKPWPAKCNEYPPRERNWKYEYQHYTRCVSNSHLLLINAQLSHVNSCKSLVSYQLFGPNHFFYHEVSKNSESTCCMDPEKNGDSQIVSWVWNYYKMVPFNTFVKNARGTNVYFWTVRSSNYTLDRHILIIKRILLRIQRVEENGTSSIYLIPKIHIYITIIKKIYCCWEIFMSVKN